MTKITLHDSQAPFTPRRDRSERFYDDAGETVQIDLPSPPDLHAEPEKIEMPEFLQAPPVEVLTVLSEMGASTFDTYERVNELLVAKLREAKGSAELARVYNGPFNGKSVVEWERKAQSINESIRWNSGRKIETI